MKEQDIDIADMQCQIFRMAQTRWEKSPEECTKIFQDNNVFDYISKCYNILHLSSYDSALLDVEDFLRNRGIQSQNVLTFMTKVGFSSIGSERAPPCINAFTTILSILFRRRLGRSPANSLTVFAQTVPPTCQLCSQNGQNCLPNAYYTWRSPFYCIGYVT